MIGGLATQQHRDGCLQAFGPSARQIRRAEAKRVRATRAAEALASRSAVEDIEDSSALVVHGSRGASLSAGCTWEHVLVAKRDALAEASMSRELQAQQAAGLLEHEGSAHGGLRTQSRIRNLQLDLCHRFASVPTSVPGLAHAEAMVGSSLRRAQDLFSINAKKVAGQYVHRLLASCWERLHDPVRERHSAAFAELAEFRKQERRGKRPPCDKLGLCVCERLERNHIPKMLQNIDKAVKAFAKERRNKDILLQGKVCVLFVGRPMLPIGEDLSRCCGGVSTTKWCTIGWQWQRPWRSLLHECRCLSEIAGQSVEQVTSMPHKLRSALQAWTPAGYCVEVFDRRFRWDVVFFEVSSDGLVIGRFALGDIEVVPSSASPGLFAIWDPSLKPRAVAPRGWGVVLSSIEGRMCEESGLDSAPEDDSASDGEMDGGKRDFGDSSVFSALWEAVQNQRAADEPDLELDGLGGDAAAADAVDDLDLDELFGPEISVGSGPFDGDSQTVAPQVAASSSGAATASPDRPPQAARHKSSATAELVFEGHRISFYLARQEFYAVCGRGCHGKLCRKVRTSRGSQDTHKSAQGRPLGFLAAWLLGGASEAVDTADAHKWGVACTREERVAARARLAACPGAEGLMSYERARRDGEPEEPIGEA